MKESRSTVFLEIIKLILQFLDKHPMRSGLAVFLSFTFLGCITLLIVIRFCAPELVLIIDAIK
tara:strand:- start:431 stop:619 length:189 start_codon:yes stop_codon:yes gene_type:complete